VLAVETFCDAHGPHQTEPSDATGTSAGDDSENRNSSY
jgi:hypothetical protein